MRLPNPHKYYNWRFLYTKVFLPTPSRTGGLITLKLPIENESGAIPNSFSRKLILLSNLWGSLHTPLSGFYLSFLDIKTTVSTWHDTR